MFSIIYVSKQVKLNNFKREFRHLTVSRKAIFIGCLLAIIFAFFPWFEITSGYSTKIEIERMTGFSGYYIFGTISVLFALISLFVLIREMLTRKLNTFSIKNSVIWMFLSGEAIFALVIAIFVFSSYFIKSSNVEFRFGIFFSIICHIVVFGAAHFALIEDSKISAKKDFQKISDEDMARLNLEPEVAREQLTLGDQ